MPERLNITILTDKTNWMNKYSQLLVVELARDNHQVRLLNSKTELPNGEVVFFCVHDKISLDIDKKGINYDKSNFNVL